MVKESHKLWSIEDILLVNLKVMALPYTQSFSWR